MKRSINHSLTRGGLAVTLFVTAAWAGGAPVRAQTAIPLSVPPPVPQSQDAADKAGKQEDGDEKSVLISTTPVVVALPGGARLVTLYEPNSPFVTMDVFFRAGTPEEGGNEGGIASLIARSWFGATDSRTAQRQQRGIEEQGGGVGAIAWGELTELWSVSGAGETERAEAARTLLWNTVASPQFAGDAVEEARTELLRDLALGADNTGEAVLAALKRRVWSVAPYGAPPQGTPESVAGITPAMVRRFYARYFRPERAVFVVAGNITPDAARALVKQNLGAGGWTDTPMGAKKTPPPSRFAPERISPDLRPVSLGRGGGAGMVAVGYLAPGTENNGKNYATLLLLDAILGGGKSARLFRDLRDGGAGAATGGGVTSGEAATVAGVPDTPPGAAENPAAPTPAGAAAATPPVGYDVRTALQAGTGQSLWAVYAVGARDARTVEAEIKRELAPLADGSRPVTEAELTRARAFLFRERLQKRQRLKERAFRTGWAEAMGLGASWETDFETTLATISADDVNQLARQLFSAPSATVSAR